MILIKLIWGSHAGKVKAEVAKIISETRYEKFDKKRKKKDAIEADNEDISISSGSQFRKYWLD